MTRFSSIRTPRDGSRHRTATVLALGALVLGLLWSLFPAASSASSAAAESSAAESSAAPSSGAMPRASHSHSGDSTQGARLGLRAFDVRWRRTASGLSAPTQVTSARDGRDRLFVVQKGGQVKIVRDGNVVNRPYLAIGGRVDPAGEGGLLSVAFSPTFRKDGLLWVTFSRQIDGDLVVARLRASGPHADHVRAKTLRPIMRIEHSSEENHFGGQLAFGPGKRLFIGTGDGGSFGDPHNNAGDRGSLLGKVLRINPFKHCKGRGYCIPDGNPFKGKRGRDEIWLMGLRNPWRFSFDKRTNRLWIGDVGQDRFEEIDRVSPRPRRIHLGWSCREGRRIYNASRCRRSVRYLGPKVVVRQPIAQSIVGGFVYRGRRYDRQIGGAYVFGDYVTRRIWLFRPGAGKVAQEARIGGGLTSFGLNDRGEIYAVTIDGSLWRMRVVRG